METLTTRGIETMEAPRERFAIAWDSEVKGLGLRIMPSGTRSFFLNYRADGKQRRAPIGRYPLITLEDARAKARGILDQLAAGNDPLATFGKIAAEYIARRCEGKGAKKSGPEGRRIIRRELIPTWGAKRASDIRRRDVLELVEKIVERGAPVAANRTLSVVKRVYSFALDRELVEVNPAARVRPPAKEISRERVLGLEEIRAFWNGLDLLPGDPQTRAALRLILATGQRPGECAGIRWEEIHETEAAATWTIPAKRSKNGRAHSVPLSKLALELVHSLEAGGSGPVFESYPHPGKPIARGSMARLLSEGLEKIGLEDVHPHDLRRTAASCMAGMGVSREVLAKILNHAERSITGRVYDRYSYQAEARAALEAWGSRLQDIITGRLVGI